MVGDTSFGAAFLLCLSVSFLRSFPSAGNKVSSKKSVALDTCGAIVAMRFLEVRASGSLYYNESDKNSLSTALLEYLKSCSTEVSF